MVRTGKAKRAKGFSFLTTQLTRRRSAVRARTGLPFHILELLPLAALREVQLHFVNVAPAPGLARLDGFHDRVLGVMEMLGGVFILG